MYAFTEITFLGCNWQPSYLIASRPLALRPRLTPGLPFFSFWLVGH